MLDCVINWRGMVSGVEQIAAAFERRGFVFSSRIIRGDRMENRNALARLVQERKTHNGIILLIGTDVLLSDGGRAADLHGRTEITVYQYASTKHAFAKLELGCTLPEASWDYVEDIPEKGASSDIRALRKRLDGAFTQLAARHGAGSGEIARHLSAVDARGLLDAIASWAVSPGMKWRNA